MLWPPDAKSWLIGKDPDAGKDWGGGEDNRGWDGWMASPTQWTWVWVNSRNWWWTGRPGVLRFMGSQKVKHDWEIELNWTKANNFSMEKKLKQFLMKITVITLEIIPVQFSSVTQSCLTLCDPMNRSTPGLPVHQQLPECTQTHVHWVGDAIQLPHPLSSPSPPAPNLSQHQGLFKWVRSLHQVAKVLEFQLQHQSFQWTPRTDFL